MAITVTEILRIPPHPQIKQTNKTQTQKNPNKQNHQDTESAKHCECIITQ